MLCHIKCNAQRTEFQIVFEITYIRKCLIKQTQNKFIFTRKILKRHQYVICIDSVEYYTDRRMYVYTFTSYKATCNGNAIEHCSTTRKENNENISAQWHCDRAVYVVDFGRLDTGVVSSELAQSMGVCPCPPVLYCLCR